MPVYDYKCPDHGVFYELQTIPNYDKPCACPKCGRLSSRIIRLAPELQLMPEQTRRVHATNERARHEPKTSAGERERLAEHGADCGCSSHRPRKSRMLLTSRGEKIFPSHRPWMISH